MLIHPIFVVFVAKFAQNLELAIRMEHGNGGMRDAVEGICLDRSVVNHVLENHFLAYLQLMVELPKAHEVAAEAAVAAEAIKELTIDN